MCRGFCKETQKAAPNYSTVVLSVNFPRKSMKFDQPLIFINSKLPDKQPGYYIKLFFLLGFGMIVLAVSFNGFEHNELLRNLAGFSFCLILISCFFAVILSHLYNVKRQASDYVNIHAPVITTSKTVNKVSDAVRGFLRFLTVMYAYILLLFILVLPIMAVVGAIAS